MLRVLSYERLSQIVKDTKPYRNAPNRYPLMRRAHGYKCFYVEKDAQGNDEYHISYQYTYVEKAIPEKEAKELIAKNNWVNNRLLSNGSTEYFLWERHRHILGIVRSDNTFEYTANSLHQGDRMFLTWANDGEVVSSVRHGGTIYREYERDLSKPQKGYYNYRGETIFRTVFWKNTVTIPLFKGQRMDICTNKSVINYEVHTPYVNRKRSKEILSEHINDLNFAEIMVKTMSKEVFISEMQEVYDKVFADMKQRPLSRGSRDSEADERAGNKMLRYAKENLTTNFYESMYAMMMGLGIADSWNIVSGTSYYYSASFLNPHEYFKALKTKLTRQLNIDKGALDTKVHKPNEVYPSSTWDIKILVDGKEVKCY